MLPPDIVAKLNECATSNFIGARDSSFVWLSLSTKCVVAGLILELPDLVYETMDFARHRIGLFRYKVVLLESRLEIAKLIAFVGWFLIVVGVAGEWYAGAKIDDLSARIQGCNEARLTEVTEQSSDANAHASAAYERASENEKETAATLKQAEQERADAAKSLEVTKGYESQIAQANERAANAEKGAMEANAKYEAEHKARLLIEQRMADRDIKPEQREAMLRVLKGLRPEHIALQSLLSEGREALQYARKIADVFTSAGWNVTPPSGMGSSSEPMIGVVMIGPNDDEANRIGEIVAEVLIAGGISRKPVGFNVNPNRQKGQLEIWVGSK
jgi:hypothetical protein